MKAIQTAAAAPLTADLCARAIIASAQAYGDDPVRAMTAKSGRPRRCLTPALYGIASVTGRKVGRLRKMLHMGGLQAKPADPEFSRAMKAAFRAAEFAAWRPDARESVVGGAAPDTLVEDRPQGAVETAPRPTPRRPALELVKNGERAAAPAAHVARPARYVVPVKVTEASALSDRILDLLKDRALTAKSLATILGVKELYVGQALSALAWAKLVDADDPPPPSGRDIMLWRIRFSACDAQ